MHAKQKVRKALFAALMDIRHIQKYEYIPENVRKNNLKCGHKCNYIPVNVRKSNIKCGNNESLNWDNRQRSGWRLSPMKSYENEFKIILRYHDWDFFRIFYMNLDKSWIMNYGSLLRERKKTSIICVTNLQNLPWNITSKAHKIRTTLKRRWIFKRASGNRCLHDVCKTQPPRAAAAAAAAIPCQFILG